MTGSRSKVVNHRVARSHRRSRIVAMIALLVVAACGPAPAPPSAPAADGWHEFEGTWTAAGTRHIISLGGERRASLVDLRGSMLLAGQARPGIGFRAEVIAFGDTTSGLTGRAVWTDEHGDQVYSELRGEGTARHNRVAGTFIGGTGRYAGATGTYEFQWQYVLEAEDGTVQGRAVGLKGRVRVGPPESPPATGGAKP
jgi:hypothetical protein